jgi:hypothetical protein
MRKLLVLVVLVGWMLLIQSPAYAWHRFYSISILTNSRGSLLILTTDCEGSKTLKLTSKSLPGGTIVRPMPGSSTKPAVQQLTIRTRLGRGSTATFKAWCGSEPVSAGKPNSKVAAISVRLAAATAGMSAGASALPDTGRPTRPWLMLGLTLVLTGGLLVAAGRRGPA